MLRRHSPARKGVAAVEVAAITAFLLVPLMIGIWEVGRMVQVQQIVSESARQGARLAAQGFTINSSGSTTQVTVNSGAPDVYDTVYQYLMAAGLTQLQKSDVNVSFQFITPTSSGTYPSDPYLGQKGELFSVTVTVNWAPVRWVNLGIVNPSTITYTVYWQMLVDDPFTINDQLPTW